MKASVTAQLRRRLGASVVRTDKATCYKASFDSSKLSFLPDAVVAPRNDKDLAVVLELANKHRVPVTVRGRGTSLTGSASPVRGGWVIDTGSEPGNVSSRPWSSLSSSDFLRFSARAAFSSSLRWRSSGVLGCITDLRVASSIVVPESSWPIIAR